MVALTFNATAQKMSNYRPNDKNGVNMFEAPKQVESDFDGINVKVGGDFAQQYQAIKHSNKADENLYDNNGKMVNLNQLYPLGSGFNLATANLNLDFQIEDGIQLKLESYMSSRHHQEFWVKGGYIQVDKLPMFNNPDWFSKNLRVKIGHMEINYGDQHFRRTDNGGAIQNPFVGNYIMDAFATEIGGEIYLFPVDNVMAMVGISNGLIKGEVADIEKAPSIYAKLAYDKQITDDFRFRLSGSVYSNSNSLRNTLYGGDRAGSRFYFAMEPEYYVSRGVFTTTGTSDRAFSGRLNPGFSNEIMSFQINPFIKFKGLEFFGTYEASTGKSSSEADKRDFNQISGELLYRFLKDEQVYIGGRYNTVSGRLQGFANDISIDRIEIAAGWYPTKNLLLKGAYVNQTYNDFPTSDLFYEGEFHGVMIEAVIGL
jgi:hypothetical protein